MTWASNCCGSSDEPDGSFAFVGLLVAIIVGGAAVGLWSGAMSPRALAWATLTVPAVCALASIWSSDFAQALTLAVPAWLLFWWFLRRRKVREWLSGPAEA
jgi:hypothetical protein